MVLELRVEIHPLVITVWQNAFSNQIAFVKSNTASQRVRKFTGINRNHYPKTMFSTIV